MTIIITLCCFAAVGNADLADSINKLIELADFNGLPITVEQTTALFIL